MKTISLAATAILNTTCRRSSGIPFILINERIAFDYIPDMEALSEAVRKAIGL
jgi:hypothetical protein